MDKEITKESLDLITLEDIEDLYLYMGRCVNAVVEANMFLENGDKIKNSREKALKHSKECKKNIDLCLNIFRLWKK